jgi:hypothetical protein
MQPMDDTYKKHSRSLTSPPEEAAAIVPGEAALGHVTRAIYVGQGGDLRVRMLRGGVVILANVGAGTLIPLRVTHVYAVGTTASQLVGLW